MTETCPLINKKTNKRQFKNITSSNDYFTSNGISYNLLEESVKPPDPKNGKYEWIWWDNRWIKMYNDVFEEEHLLRRLVSDHCFNCC